jgi:hypothetical protein
VEEVKSRTIKLKNAMVTVHGYSSGTVVFNMTSRKEDCQHAAIWINTDELNDLSDLLRSCQEMMRDA